MKTITERLLKISARIVLEKIKGAVQKYSDSDWLIQKFNVHTLYYVFNFSIK